MSVFLCEVKVTMMVETMRYFIHQIVTNNFRYNVSRPVEAIATPPSKSAARPETVSVAFSLYDITMA